MSNVKTKEQSTILYPSIDAMAADALAVVQIEITRFKTKVHQGRSLDSREPKLYKAILKA